MKTKKIALLLALALSATLVFAGCSNNTDKPSTSPTNSSTPTEKLSGSVTLDGSTSMQELTEALIEAFRELQPNVSVTAQYTGSGTGIESAIAGKVDIGNSSRALKDEETTSLTANSVAIDGIAVVLNPANKVADITLEQLTQIYKGEIKNWKDIGGSDLPIIVIGRDSASGTRGAFEEIIKAKDECSYAKELNSTGGVATDVASNEGAIGYVSLEAVNESVKAMKINGVEATEENIKDESYKLSRPFVMAVKKEGTSSAAVQAFIDFALSTDGQTIVKNLKLISVK